ncbi:hypothetical protein EJB05_31226 [Eragrostis curvula]|uniref:Uncharacterized protein n=1 Tax=Eragrostis curvula TaxID=38414 RepID=A0A5J9UCU6_9POAL|nr:hypothetical protein EJB05_31226 [Eragrostis curvula]
MAMPTLPPVATFGGRCRRLRTYYVFLINLLHLLHYFCVDEDLDLGIEEDIDLGWRTDGSAMSMGPYYRPTRVLYDYITGFQRRLTNVPNQARQLGRDRLKDMNVL